MRLVTWKVNSLAGERVPQEAGWIEAGAGGLRVASVYDPAAFGGSTHVTEGERRRLRAVLERGRLVEVFRRLHPVEPGSTWWDDRAGHFHRRMGPRIDHLLLSEQLAGAAGPGLT
jgi:exonuclease III